MSQNKLRFSRWHPVDDTLSVSALLSPGQSQTGIYVLEFSDGEEYVGQTTGLLSRVAAHRRRWPGEIVGLRFAPVRPDDLDLAERDTISRLHADGARLRNVALVSLPLHSEALDYVIDPALQQDWLDGAAGQVVLGDRAARAAQRKRTQRAHAKLAARKDYQDLLGSLALYVGECLPYPHQTERRFWTVTSLPATGRGPDFHRLAAISVNNVETLVLEEACEPGGPWERYGFINVALGEKRLRVRGTQSEIGHYGTTGEVQRFFFGSMSELRALLDHPRVAEAARRLALGLLRKGTSMFGRFHDYNLADDIFLCLDAKP
ncbi:MAG: GIY-YIG nuclease family protein [Bifidobacteriaceae bacterium]|nr:GIY-YIG nuclease family protein [Bifidobacteriaceae bacterium]